MAAHSPEAMKRWSCQKKLLPSSPSIKALHIYDFDSTLFRTPLPNQRIWSGPSTGMLSSEDTLAGGGWWHDSLVLASTGDGVEAEEQRAWERWWAEDIVKLVRLSIQQKDALTILLTGRSEKGFADLITRMVASKKLEFDMVCLKPQKGPTGQRFTSTMQYKTALLEELIYTYRDAKEIKIYEDRPKHVRNLRDFLDRVNKGAATKSLPVPRLPINGTVVQVPDQSATLNPVTEISQVQRMINTHNAVTPYQRLQIKRTVFYTGYLLDATGTANLVSLIPLPSSANSDASSLKVLGNNIMIAPRPATAAMLDKVGGLGAKQIWQVSATGTWQHSVWAARVQPVPPTAPYFTESPHPIVVLACRKGAKTADANLISHWTPVPSERQFVFETTVGEKAQLRIEREGPDDEPPGPDGAAPHGRAATGPHGLNGHRGAGKRKAPDDGEDRRDDHRRASGPHRGGHAHRGRGGRGGGGGGSHAGDPYPTRGNRDRNRRGGGAGAGGGGGGGGGPTGGSNRNRVRGVYKSLDDVPNGPRNGYAPREPDYGDAGARPSDRDTGGMDYMPLDPVRGNAGAPGVSVGGRTMYDDGGLPYGQ